MDKNIDNFIQRKRKNQIRKQDFIWGQNGKFISKDVFGILKREGMCL